MSKLTTTQLEYLKDRQFLYFYLNNLNNRLVHSNNRIDIKSKNKDMAHEYTIQDNLEALYILINNKELTKELIIKVANKINEHSPYISLNYRKADNNIKFDGVPIEDSKNIKLMMNKLLYNYHNTWSKLDIFEKESLFNKEFIRIHPFEDGNGRTSRLILAYNLLKEGYAPVIINENIKEEYNKNRNNTKWLTNFFKEESKKESLLIDRIIKDYEEQINNNKKR